MQRIPYVWENCFCFTWEIKKKSLKFVFTISLLLIFYNYVDIQSMHLLCFWNCRPNNCKFIWHHFKTIRMGAFCLICEILFPFKDEIRHGSLWVNFYGKELIKFILHEYCSLRLDISWIFLVCVGEHCFFALCTRLCQCNSFKFVSLCSSIV